MASTSIVAPAKVHCIHAGTVPSIFTNSGSKPNPTNAEPMPNTAAPNEMPKTTNTHSSIEPNINVRNPRKEKNHIFTKVAKQPPAFLWFSGSFTNFFARFTPCISSSLIAFGVTCLPFICKRSSAVLASGISAQQTA